MMCGEEVFVCSEINRKHVNAVWQNVQLLNVKPDGAPKQWALNG